jgi:3-deoxy-D-manno-octulosonate 8-phosphate phosphatase (KDO 8-P phosphatase)
LTDHERVLTKDELAARAKRLRMVLTDCDGVLTDTGVYFSARGEEMKRFSIRDGMGVELLRDAGVAVAIVTGELSESVKRRAEKLAIEAHLGIKDKVAAVRRIAETKGIAIGEMAYIGDDVNDLAAMELVAEHGGLVAAPADAMERVAEVVHHRAQAAGGHGAFRDFAEWILRLREEAVAASRR